MSKGLRLWALPKVTLDLQTFRNTWRDSM